VLGCTDGLALTDGAKLGESLGEIETEGGKVGSILGWLEAVGASLGPPDGS
jgi:hypothetical protein